MCNLIAEIKPLLEGVIGSITKYQNPIQHMHTHTHTHTHTHAHAHAHTQVKPGSNDVGLCDISSVLSDITAFTQM